MLKWGAAEKAQRSRCGQGGVDGAKVVGVEGLSDPSYVDQKITLVFCLTDLAKSEAN
jgi:hypothetical protein